MKTHWISVNIAPLKKISGAILTDITGFSLNLPDCHWFNFRMYAPATFKVIVSEYHFAPSCISNLIKILGTGINRCVSFSPKWTGHRNGSHSLPLGRLSQSSSALSVDFRMPRTWQPILRLEGYRSSTGMNVCACTLYSLIRDPACRLPGQSQLPWCGSSLEDVVPSMW